MNHPVKIENSDSRLFSHLKNTLFSGLNHANIKLFNDTVIGRFNSG